MQGELPPRARRILAGEAQRRTNQGTTSACAENTTRQHGCGYRVWNYLRVRGEYRIRIGTTKFEKELPPRARRIPRAAFSTWIPTGTTSACAENTCLSRLPSRKLWNYLRVRGEYVQEARTILNRGNYLRVRGEYFHRKPGLLKTRELPPRARRILAAAEVELPPRARRIRFPLDVYLIIQGTTSACAENTQPIGSTTHWQRNYLRVRGEYR